MEISIKSKRFKVVEFKKTWRLTSKQGLVVIDYQLLKSDFPTLEDVKTYITSNNLV